MWNLVVAIIISSSIIVGYFIRKYSGEEVNNFLKDHPKFKIFENYQKIRAIIYGLILAILIQSNFPESSLIIFSIGVIEGGVFSSKKLKKVILITGVIFLFFLIGHLIQKPF